MEPRFPDDSTPGPALPGAKPLLLAVLVGACAAVIGGGLMHLVARLLLYIPLIPGAVVGYAVSRFCRTDHRLVGVIAGFFGFAGMVFGDALTFEMIDYPGFWNYLTHFWHAAGGLKVILWLANFAIAFWFARVAPGSEYRGMAVTGSIVQCHHCGQGNLPHSKFCAHCGQSMPSS